MRFYKITIHSIRILKDVYYCLQHPVTKEVRNKSKKKLAWLIANLKRQEKKVKKNAN